MEYNFNYKLKFQVSLHLHHLSQVRARCPAGAHTVHVWLVLSVRAVRVWPSRYACWLVRGARVWLAHGARTVRVWLAHGARLARLRPLHMAPGV